MCRQNLGLASIGHEFPSVCFTIASLKCGDMRKLWFLDTPLQIVGKEPRKGPTSWQSPIDTALKAIFSRIRPCEFLGKTFAEHA